MNSTLLDAAREYLAQGISVVPVDGKIPVKSWKIFQTRFANEDDILEWHGTFPTGIAAITGEISGICVVDLDDLGWLTTVDWPETCRATSGRGIHLYFLYPQGRFIRSMSGLKPHMDVKAMGGLITLPPSKHVATGKTYEWQVPFARESLAELPDWITCQLEEKKVAPQSMSWQNLHRSYRTREGWITSSTREKAKSVLIQSVLQGHTWLERSGHNRLVALCPFHKERTPSFTVFLKDNTFHCFGCAVNGDVITLAMKLNNYKYPEAVHWLCNTQFREINV